jgi:hypothetical protein
VLLSAKRSKSPDCHREHKASDCNTYYLENSYRMFCITDYHGARRTIFDSENAEGFQFLIHSDTKGARRFPDLMSPAARYISFMDLFVGMEMPCSCSNTNKKFRCSFSAISHQLSFGVAKKEKSEGAKSGE